MKRIVSPRFTPLRLPQVGTQGAENKRREANGCKKGMSVEVCAAIDKYLETRNPCLVSGRQFGWKVGFQGPLACCLLADRPAVGEIGDREPYVVHGRDSPNLVTDANLRRLLCQECVKALTCIWPNRGKTLVP